MYLYFSLLGIPNRRRRRAFFDSTCRASRISAHELTVATLSAQHSAVHNPRRKLREGTGGGKYHMAYTWTATWIGESPSLGPRHSVRDHGRREVSQADPDYPTAEPTWIASNEEEDQKGNRDAFRSSYDDTSGSSARWQVSIHVRGSATHNPRQAAPISNWLTKVPQWTPCRTLKMQPPTSLGRYPGHGSMSSRTHLHGYMVRYLGYSRTTWPVL